MINNYSRDVFNKKIIVEYYKCHAVYLCNKKETYRQRKCVKPSMYDKIAKDMSGE